MTFFSRPNLSDEQFKQLAGTTLTLSGSTRIANPTGFSLSPDGTTFIPIIVTSGRTNYHVLTYINGQIVLNVPSSGNSTGYYTCASPTTITVGGLPANSPISGCSISQILQEILVPTVNPTVVEPFSPSVWNSSSFVVTPSTSILENGCQITFTGVTTANKGSVNPQYCGSSSFRSAGITAYCYDSSVTGPVCIPSTGLTDSHTFPLMTISLANNYVAVQFAYAAGTTPAYNSSSGISCTLLSAGLTPTKLCCTICGVLPWYWGLSSTNNFNGTCIALCGCGLGGKCVGISDVILPICFNSSPSDYIWFAVPCGISPKTCWYVNGTNNGCIGGTNNLFATSCLQCVTSAQGCWTNQCYSVYVSCVPTGTACNIPMCMY